MEDSMSINISQNLNESFELIMTDQFNETFIHEVSLAFFNETGYNFSEELDPSLALRDSENLYESDWIDRSAAGLSSNGLPKSDILQATKENEVSREFLASSMNSSLDHDGTQFVPSQELLASQLLAASSGFSLSDSIANSKLIAGTRTHAGTHRVGLSKRLGESMLVGSNDLLSSNALDFSQLHSGSHEFQVSGLFDPTEKFPTKNDSSALKSKLVLSLGIGLALLVILAAIAVAYLILRSRNDGPSMYSSGQGGELELTTACEVSASDPSLFESWMQPTEAFTQYHDIFQEEGQEGALWGAF
jgi:hypothetical protein